MLDQDPGSRFDKALKNCAGIFIGAFILYLAGHVIWLLFK